MRLIDAERVNLYDYGHLREITQEAIDLLNDEPTVEAIPVEWMLDYISCWVSEAYKNFVLQMITKWREENGTDRQR